MCNWRTTHIRIGGGLSTLTEEAVSLKDHIKSLEENVVKVTNLKHQVELDEYSLAQAQQRIR
jgi:hypothetical protein